MRSLSRSPSRALRKAPGLAESRFEPGLDTCVLRQDLIMICLWMRHKAVVPLYCVLCCLKEPRAFVNGFCRVFIEMVGCRLCCSNF